MVLEGAKWEYPLLPKFEDPELENPVSVEEGETSSSMTGDGRLRDEADAAKDATEATELAPPVAFDAAEDV